MHSEWGKSVYCVWNVCCFFGIEPFAMRFEDVLLGIWSVRLKARLCNSTFCGVIIIIVVVAFTLLSWHVTSHQHAWNRGVAKQKKPAKMVEK